MPATTVDSAQIRDGTVQRSDLNTSTVGQSVVAKLLQGSNISLSSTGADAGTGDVTVSCPTGGYNGFVSKSAAYTVTAADIGKYFVCTGGSWALTLPSPINGFWIQVRNDQGITGTTGLITLSPPSGTIDGLATQSLCAGQDCTIICDGTNWRTLGRQRYVLIGTIDPTNVGNQTILLPAGYRSFHITGNNLRVSNTGGVLEAVISFDGGSTFNQTANYQYGLIYPNAATTVANSSGVNITYFLFSAPITTAQQSSLEVDIYPGDSANMYPIMNTKSGGYSSGIAVTTYIISQFFNQVLGRVNAINIFCNNGGTFLGQFNVFGAV